MLRVERSFLFNYHDHVGGQIKEKIFMAFFNSAVTVLQTLVIALGIWGAINLLEGYGNDNPGAKSQGIKQLMSGGGIIIVAQTVISQLTTLFS